MRPPAPWSQQVPSRRRRRARFAPPKRPYGLLWEILRRPLIPAILLYLIWLLAWALYGWDGYQDRTGGL